MFGQVVWFNLKRGFGFVKGHADGVQYFTHRTNIISKKASAYLAKGQLVAFDAEKDSKGRYVAVNVKPISLEYFQQANLRITQIELKYKPGECFNPVLRNAP